MHSLLLVAALVLGAGHPATVLDDFLSLPDSALSAPRTAADRRGLFDVVDLRNGFLSGPELEVALFIETEGTHVLAIVSRIGCPSGNPLRLLEHNADQWQDVTDALLPPLNMEKVQARSHTIW